MNQYPINNMKRTFTFLVGLLLFQYGQSQDAPMAFSLQKCIEFAKENNPNLKNAQIAIKSSEAKVGETLSIGLPRILLFQHPFYPLKLWGALRVNI